MLYVMQALAVIFCVLQTATFYKDGNHFVPKEFSFKIQSVNGDGIKDRKTIGKCKASQCSVFHELPLN